MVCDKMEFEGELGQLEKLRIAAGLARRSAESTNSPASCLRPSERQQIIYCFSLLNIEISKLTDFFNSYNNNKVRFWQRDLSTIWSRELLVIYFQLNVSLQKEVFFPCK